MKLTIPENDDLWDPENSRFISIKEQTLILEHSLISLAKWEKITKKSFLYSAEKEDISSDEWILYIKCMTINNVNDYVYNCITPEMFKQVFDYINDPMTATTINDRRPKTNRGRKEIITAEILYYQMIYYGIPVEFEKWHLNTLTTLIGVFAIKGGNPEKMSSSEAGAYQRAINESRKLKGRR